MKEISRSDFCFRNLHIGLEFMIPAYCGYFFGRKCVTVVQLILQRPSRRVYELKTNRYNSVQLNHVFLFRMVVVLDRNI